MARPPDIEKDLQPAERSRVGDFVFCGVAGIMAIISALMLGHAPAAAWILIGGLFLGALAVRFLALSDAQTVRPGLNVSEEELEALRRLRVLMDTFPQPVMLLDGEGHVEMANLAAHRNFNEDITKHHISGLIRSPKAQDCLRNAHHTGKPCEVEFTTTTVPERHMLFYAAPVKRSRGLGEQASIVMLRDRTEQKKLERMRTDFVANASHELRTPLASMSGFIETLQGHAKDDPAARTRFLGIMAAQVERMLRLVEDLIGLSAIEMNESKPPSERVDIGKMLQSVRENLMPVAFKNNVEIVLQIPDRPVEIIGDSMEIFRLLLNLSDNAIKYGVREDGDRNIVTISLGHGEPPSSEDALFAGDTVSQIAARAGIPVAEMVWIQVRDNGFGIAEEDLPRLTERFYRVNPELSKAKGGTGLGLAIVKHILQRHRAGLQIETIEGQGTAFTCLFPGPEAWKAPVLKDAPLEKRTERA